MSACGPQGAPGAAGRTPLTPAVAGRDGRDGRQLVQPFQEVGFIPTAAPLGWLSAALHDAELLLVNQKYDLATAELNWVQTIVRSCQVESRVPALEEAESKALALLGTIASGVDVFGRNLNYVPLTSFELGETLVRRQLAYLDPVEAALAQLKQAEQAQQDGLRATKAAVGQFNDFERDANKDVGQLADKTAALQDEISRLFEDLKVLHQRLLQAEKDFKDAVQRRAGCNFGDVVKFAAMVATVVSTAGAGAAAVGAMATAYKSYSTWTSLAAQNATWKNIKADYSAISGFVKPVRGEIADFRTAYNDAKGAIDAAFPATPTTPDELRVSDDYAKILTAKADFDKAIEPYLKMSAARKYKALMDQFVALAECRNNKIVEHDNTVARIFETRSRIQFERRRIQVVAATTLKTFDSRRADNISYLDAGMTTLKWKLIRQLTDLESSLEYMSGESVQVDYSDFSVAALQLVAADLLQKYGAALQLFGQENQYGTAFTVKIKDILDDEYIEFLLAGGKVTFSLSPLENDLFKGLYAVQAGRIGLADRNGRPVPGAINASIQHLGRSIVRLRNREYRTYTHVPVAATYAQGGKGNVITRGQLLERLPAGQSRFVGVSPYGPWRLQLNGPVSNSVKSAIRSGVVTFDVAFRTLQI